MEKKKPQRKKSTGFGGILTGICLLILGVGLLGRKIGFWPGFTPFFPGWLTVDLTIIALIDVCNRGLKKINGLMLAVGLYLLITGQRSIGTLLYFLALGLVIEFALHMIARAKPLRFRRVIDESGNALEMPVYRSLLGDRALCPEAAETLPGAIVRSWGGKLTLDLRNASITQDIVLDVMTGFGSADILLPEQTSLLLVRRCGFAKLHNRTIPPQDSHSPTIFLSAALPFADLTVRHI